MSSSVDHPVEGEGADEDFVEAAADAPDVTENDDGNDDAESYDTEDEDPVEVIRAQALQTSALYCSLCIASPSLPLVFRKGFESPSVLCSISELPYRNLNPTASV